MSNNVDRIFSEQLAQMAPFHFNEQVAAVFDDMIVRSVPGYQTIINTIAKLTNKFAKPNTNLYDLGCSLGTAINAMGAKLTQNDCSLIAVDSSKAMISKAKALYADNKTNARTVQFLCADIIDANISNASVVVLNFTMQFIAIKHRRPLLTKIYRGLKPGGLLVLSEKIMGENPQLDALLSQLYWDFKRQNGYSDLEIMQKHASLKGVLRPETISTHLQRLSSIGFCCEKWFQQYNFASIIAIK